MTAGVPVETRIRTSDTRVYGLAATPINLLDKGKATSKAIQNHNRDFLVGVGES